MLIAQMTDFHVTARGSKVMGVVDTNAHLASAVAHVNALDPAPDLVIMTGDLVNDGGEEEYAALADILAQLRIPYCVLPGNHDDRALLRRHFGDADWFPKAGDFIQYALDVGPLRLIALDTQVPGRPHGILDASRIEWLVERLKDAPDRPTLIAMHHPPFETGIVGLDTMRCQGEEDLARALAHSGNIVGIVCGHYHRAVSTCWRGYFAVCAPSTAHQIALDLVPVTPGRWTLEPPAVMLHRWHPEGGLVSHLSAVGDYPARPFR